ncbi:MAG TPA: hypothetical protein VLS48_06710 [Anaerolineales bacterium]|nr:hypothetical protein [Anaerolineales bacterium]
MKVGMLWFDNDQKRGLNERVLRAALYYQQKYGQKPNLCFVHPSMLPEAPEAADDHKYQAGEVEVRSAPVVLPNYFWIGEQASVQN